MGVREFYSGFWRCSSLVLVGLGGWVCEVSMFTEMTVVGAEMTRFVGAT